MNGSIVRTLQSLDCTRRLAEELAEQLCRTDVTRMTVALVGNLGAGKTQLVRFLCAALGVAQEDVTSPTYVLLQRYVGRRIVYHYDFYRLESEEEVWDLGVDEIFEQPVLVFIEWPDRFPECLPDDHLRIEITHQSEMTRSVQISASGELSGKILTRLCKSE